MLSDPVISAIAYPVAIGLACLFASDRLKVVIKAVSLLTAIYVLVAAVQIFIKKPQSAMFVADSLSAFTVAAAAVFAVLVVIYSIGFVTKNFGRYFGYVLITIGCSLGAVYANNLVVLIVFWGFLALMLYLLTAMGDTEKARFSAKKALVIIGGTDALALFGVALMWSLAGTFSMDKIQLKLSGLAPCMAYAMIAIASFAKSGAVPFGSWLPDVAENAPSPVAAYLPASLDKLLGIYLLVRASLGLFEMNAISNTALAAIGSVTIIFAVLMALVQHDLKRLLGYHAISQVGYMVLGIGTGTAIGIAGGLFHMLNNAVYKSCLFFTSGSVEKATGTTNLSKLGGLAKYMPVTFACFLVASLSISGIPPFNGFVSKWMIYQGIIESVPRSKYLWILWLSAAMFGSALTVASFMKLLHAVFMGRASKGLEKTREAGFYMSLPPVILALLCVGLGVLAFSIPIALWIMPSVGLGAIFVGSWDPVIATALILAGITIGAIAYLLIRSSKTRVTGSFIGGEDQDKLKRVSGAEFYNTVKDVGAMEYLYKKEASGGLDIYNLGAGIVLSWTGLLKKMHNGILPTYLVWCLLGAVGIFLVLFFR